MLLLFFWLALYFIYLFKFFHLFVLLHICIFHFYHLVACFVINFVYSENCQFDSRRLLSQLYIWTIIFLVGSTLHTLSWWFHNLHIFLVSYICNIYLANVLLLLSGCISINMHGVLFCTINTIITCIFYCFCG